MPFGDGIDKKFCFSLTDFHDFDFCQFRFFVKHFLDKKYELEDGNEHLALGILLDQSIKIFHDSKAYSQPKEYLPNIVKAAQNHILQKVQKQSGPSFYSSILPFLTPQLFNKAYNTFQDYHQVLDGKIKQSIGPVGFCEWIIENENSRWKLWGGPDTLEMGDDGVVEVVDYKSRQDIEKGKDSMDMDLMPKIYTLLVAKQLLGKGYTKARFIVRFWQDPREDSFYEEFDLEQLAQIEEIFKQRIAKILATVDIKFCNKVFCKACNSDKKDEYLLQLNKLGFISSVDNLLIQNQAIYTD